jgi:predicted RNA-binding Zn-ribbon protein involved in translation (DUF1610 family)
MKVEKNSYCIKLIPDKLFEKNWEKEIIRLRKASRNLICDECGGEIKKGELYIRDKFYYPIDWDITKKVVNFVCLKCWKGEIPKKISRNWKKTK